eukprot:TRINITY_DN609_c0_g2_i2.p4 TRINITY_DN609_c0_g2~~TRINITY_DN609_c0_g2_i2.p4  ORF type:complete len:133 (+),score=1.97 TRINITY_DN609_c0_g2_i2:1028-1426(+)
MHLRHAYHYFPSTTNIPSLNNSRNGSQNILPFSQFSKLVVSTCLTSAGSQIKIPQLPNISKLQTSPNFIYSCQKYSNLLLLLIKRWKALPIKGRLNGPFVTLQLYTEEVTNLNHKLYIKYIKKQKPNVMITT